MSTVNGTALARRSGGAGVSIAAQNLDPIALGQVLAQSGFFQDSKDAAQAAVKVMAGAELGFGPVASMTGIYIVKGRVTLSANLMAAAIKGHPHYTYRVLEHTVEKCAINFLEDGEIIGTSEFSMADANKAGLSSSQTWKQHPRNMLFARALSNGAKWYCPDAFGGGPVYTPDELGAEVDGATGEVVAPQQLLPNTASEPAPEPAPVLLSEESVKEIIATLTASRPENEAVRNQMILIGAPDVPEVMCRTVDGDYQVNRAPLAKLTAEQAVELMAWASGDSEHTPVEAVVVA